jgi:hypothetical protein
MKTIWVVALLGSILGWTAFLGWTIHRLRKIDSKRFDRMTFGLGVWLPGIYVWIALTLLMVRFWFTHSMPWSLAAWTLGIAAYSLPICLWGGYVLCVAILAAFPSRDDGDNDIGPAGRQ